MNRFIWSTLTLLALFQFQSTAATYFNCTAAAPGNNATACYPHRDQCHFVAGTVNRCQYGSPTSCFDFYKDAIGCATQDFCVLNNITGQCENRLPACNTLGSFSSCTQQAGCIWTGSACTNGTSTCAAFADSSACFGAGCWWDFYLEDLGIQRCFAAPAEVKSKYPCARWSNLGDPNYACAAHQCTTFGNLCQNLNVLDPAAIAQDASSTFEVAWVNANVLPGTRTFEMDIQIPIHLSASDPVWQTVTIGYDGNGNDQPIVTPSACNTLGSLAPGANPTPFVYSNIDALTQYYIADVRSTQDMTFLNDTMGQLLYKMVGNQTVGLNSIVKSADVLAGEQLYQLHVSVDLNTLVSRCRSLGATYQLTSTAELYNVPIAVQFHYANGVKLQTGIFFNISFLNNGDVYIGQTNRNDFKVTLTQTKPIFSDCPVGQKRLSNTYRLQYLQVFNANQVVGPRNISDIMIGRSPITNQLFNCYGDAAVSLTVPPFCVNAVCEFTLLVQSKCRTIGSDGQAFLTCGRAEPDDRIADMGGDVAYPPALDRSHSFFVNGWSCPANRTNNNACVQANLSPLGYPDSVTSYLSTAAPANMNLNGYLRVECGFLPTPTSPIEDLIVFAYDTQGVNGSYYGTDLHNIEIAASRAVTFACRMATADARLTNRLRVMTPINNFRLYPIDSTGTVVTNAGCTSLTWMQIQTDVQYDLKNDNEARCNSQCDILKACRTVEGCDGFSITKQSLTVKCPAVGYQAHLTYNRQQLVPFNLTLAAPSAGRRLLTVDGALYEIVQVGDEQVLVVLPIWLNGTASIGHLIDHDGDHQTIKQSAIAVGSAAAVLVGTMLTFVARSWYEKQ